MIICLNQVDITGDQHIQTSWKSQIKNVQYTKTKKKGSQAHYKKVIKSQWEKEK